VSYTFTRADFSDINRSYPFRYEQRHVVKLIGVLRWGVHELGARFEMFTGFPYTPIDESTCISSCGKSFAQYSPTTSGATNSANYPLFHRLDIRFTRKSFYSWGSFSWFIEFINVYNNEPKVRQAFDSSRPFEAGSNPTLRGPQTPLNLIPNFGFEWKF